MHRQELCWVLILVWVVGPVSALFLARCSPSLSLSQVPFAHWPVTHSLVRDAKRQSVEADGTATAPDHHVRVAAPLCSWMNLADAWNGTLGFRLSKAFLASSEALTLPPRLWSPPTHLCHPNVLLCQLSFSLSMLIALISEYFISFVYSESDLQSHRVVLSFCQTHTHQ